MALMDFLSKQFILAALRRRGRFPGEVRDVDRARVVEREVLSQAVL